MKDNQNIQELVYDLQEEDQLTKSIIKNIVNNLDKQISRAGNDTKKIGRLLTLRCHIESQLDRPVIDFDKVEELVVVAA